MFAPQNPGRPKTKEVLLGIGPKLGRARKTPNGISLSVPPVTQQKVQSPPIWNP